MILRAQVIVNHIKLHYMETSKRIEIWHTFLELQVKVIHLSVKFKSYYITWKVLSNMSSAISSKEKLVCAQFAQFQKIKRWRNILHSQESITYGNYFLYVQPACFCSCNGREWPWIHYTMGFNLWFEHWQILSITWYLQIKKLLLFQNGLPSNPLMY